jgi:hypothetical protein
LETIQASLLSLQKSKGNCFKYVSDFLLKTPIPHSLQDTADVEEISKHLQNASISKPANTITNKDTPLLKQIVSESSNSLVEPKLKEPFPSINNVVYSIFNAPEQPTNSEFLYQQDPPEHKH